MIPVEQTIPFEEGAIVSGNCLAAAVASIYELPIEAVPHFAQFDSKWGAALALYVESRGFALTKLHTAPIGGEITLAFGKSPRGAFSHAVVWQNDAVLHDPHPSKAGLDGYPDEFWSITRPIESEEPPPVAHREHSDKELLITYTQPGTTRAQGLRAVYRLADSPPTIPTPKKIAEAASLLEPYTLDIENFGHISLGVTRRAYALLTE